MIRDTVAADADAIVAIIESGGQFDADGLAYVKKTLADHLKTPAGDFWFTADDGEPVGVAYCTPEPVTKGTWNLQMLWVRPDRQGQGHGSALVAHVERALARTSARLLIVETSGLPDFAAARAFYAKCGFIPEATIRNFFAEGDDKRIYTKAL